MSRLRKVLSRIDEANARDPAHEDSPRGPQPAALLYGERMMEMLSEYDPKSSEELRIAVRGQHIERWMRPRSAFPEGRAGYLAWRRAASEHHALRLSDIMRAAGYDESSCSRVSTLVCKKNLKADKEAQTLEDVACLVFMRWYLVAFAAKHASDLVASIALKTARKMSPRGRAKALELSLPPDITEAIRELD